MENVKKQLFLIKVTKTSCTLPWWWNAVKVILNISMNCNVREMRETIFLEKEIKQTPKGCACVES